MYLSLLFAALCPLFIGCSSDDDETTPPPVDDGVSVLRTIGDFAIFDYNADGKLKSIKYPGTNAGILFSYNPFSLSGLDDSYSYYDFTLNNKGLVSAFKYAPKAGGLVVEQSVEYDNAKRMTGFVQKYNWDEGQNTTVTVEMEWNNGNMSSCKATYTTDDGNVYYQEIAIPRYGNIENKGGQISYSQYFILGDLVLYKATGVFGDCCSKLLPESVTVTEYRKGENPEIETTNFSYELNADGTIAKEVVDGKTYVYSYYLQKGK